MTTMETDELPVVLSSANTSTLSLSLHPLPILNISEHLTRLQLQQNTNLPFVIGALLGTQNGREVEIVNTFELSMDDGASERLNHAFLDSRKDQYKQVFPSLELIGWYTVTQEPTLRHIALHEQFAAYTSNPILLILQPNGAPVKAEGHSLPLKAYEPTVEIREHTSRTVFIEVGFSIEIGEAERIAVDWTAKGGEVGTSLDSHLQTQRAAVKMLHDRIQLLIQYVSGVLSGSTPKDHTALRSLSSLIASLPASEHAEFREEFDKEYEDVQLTAVLSSLTNSANILNDLVDKHNALSGIRDDSRMGGGFMKRRRGPMAFGMMGDWDRGI
ncbi:COP9 signalosome subunit 6 [Pyrrhoderma noxium]|uniref:COP9 signalosome complex subunit 6 n=1 Tax=Pyrrhoderma noxium TaxID=2282107 RepID=A0A286UQF9_9AGAM|nr:COP9 signalosome subunit 6 [Pyrrhoderma noxium]